MSAGTRVPQSSNPPPREGVRGLWSLVSAKGIHLRRTWAQVSGTRPHGRSLGRPLEPRGPGLGIFPGALSGPGRPLSPGECPRRPLTPAGRLHPAISGPPPPWSSHAWGRGASNWPTWRQTRRPLRPVPATAKNRGEAPRRWLLSEPRLGGFRAKRRGRAGASRPPHHKHPSGQRARPLRYQARFTGSLGRCQSSGKPSLPPRGTRVFPWTTLPSSSPTPAEAECQGRTRDLGPGRGAGPGSAPGGAGPGGRVGGTLVHGPVLPWGVWPVPRLGG